MTIALRGICRSFGTFVALDDVSIDVPAGSLTALLGPSGSGKSTLLRVIAGLERPDSGAVSIDGQSVNQLPPEKRNVGFVFQHYAAFTHMTVWENVAFGLKVRRRPKAQVRERVAELLRLVQLDGLDARYPAQISGGQRQRMALARALATDPRVLLLDEPFGALDAEVRRDLREWLRHFHEQAHVTTLLVTHDQEEALEVADQIVMLRRGRVEQAGSPQDLYERPANEFVMRSLGRVTRFADGYVRPHDIDVLDRPVPGSLPATVERVVDLGFEVRVELRLPNGAPLTAQFSRAQARDLDIATGQHVFARAARWTDLTQERDLVLANGQNGHRVFEGEWSNNTMTFGDQVES